MKSHLLSVAAAGAVAALAFASTAGAQTPAAGPAYGLTGAAPGVCVVSSATLLAESAVGRAIDTRMKQLIAAVNAEVTAEQTAVETERKAIEAAAPAATTPAAQAPLQARAQALQTRFDNLQRRAQLRENELRATQAKALGRVGEAARPLIRQVGNQRSCGVIFDSSSIADANPAMDISQAVMQQLNTRLPTLTFERERLDTPAAAAPAAR